MKWTLNGKAITETEVKKLITSDQLKAIEKDKQAGDKTFKTSKGLLIGKE